MIFQYETSKDEDAALAIELMKINGQLVSQGNQPVDLQGMFTLFVRDRLRPLTIQTLQARVAPLVQAFIDGSDIERDQLLASAPAKK